MALKTRSIALMKFGMALPKLQRIYKAAADKAVAPAGVSQTLAFPLVMLSRLGGSGAVRQSTLADALGIEAPSLARSLDQLVEAGLAERRDDPADRRAKTLHLTPSGGAARDQIEARLHEMREVLFDGIPDADIDTCLRVFALLGQRLGSPLPEMPSSAP